MAGFRDFVNRALQVGLDLLTSSEKKDGPGAPAPGRPGPGAPSGARTVPSSERARRITYAPDLDGAADPGEIVWTWVPFEEDASQGKDRPVLVVARAGRNDGLLGLMLSSQGHRADDANWVPIGSGAWDREGRDSYVRLDRVLEVPEHGIRREGAVVPQDRFDAVARELRSSYGWS
ncbi:type II toxin-antitoxin system PemK/MazF family toxin [Actinomycetospora atypica]|uniref:Type II toxin-antitoxin system PemK/MazF family toxin n=1 Tax=Actinomycetospora atypica TaxID=1290095 RepID=A0ABV9YTC2_9PSEU